MLSLSGIDMNQSTATSVKGSSHLIESHLEKSNIQGLVKSKVDTSLIILKDAEI